MEKEIREITKIFGNGIIRKDTVEEPRFPGIVGTAWIYNFETNNYEPASETKEDIKS